jgi:hypothetical protein
VQVNGKSILLYIQESTGSNPGPKTGHSEVLPWRFSGLAGKCQGSISTQGKFTTATFFPVQYTMIILFLTAKLNKDKGKVHPRTGHEGPEGQQRYSSSISLTSALEWN